MLAGKREAFRLLHALHDRDGVVADLREDLRVPGLEFVGRKVGLVVLRARRGWNDSSRAAAISSTLISVRHLVRACSCLARAGSCCLSLEGSIVGAGCGYERVTFSDAAMSASRITRITSSAKPDMESSGF